MKEELLEWMKKLWLEKPDSERGRPVPPEIYCEVLHFLIWNYPKIQLLSSEKVMNLTGRSNMLFCGHFIYPQLN